LRFSPASARTDTLRPKEPYRKNHTFRLYPAALIEENKWRAVRYGLDGKLLDRGKQQELPARALIREMIDWFVGDVVDELGTRQEVEYAYRIKATYAFIRSMRMRAVSGRMMRGSGSTPARSFSRSSRPLIDTCL
jgi:gamma-glutamyl:cysteine ligase YbdK (ATP-grasp superfamily)